LNDIYHFHKDFTMLLASVITASAIFAQCDSTNQSVQTSISQPAPTIVEVAASNPDFSTLVAAINAAELTETLAGPGPFTVFAPTNAAFAKLKPGTVEMLVKPENKQALTDILTYHVVPGNMPASKVMSTNGGQTAGGRWVQFSRSGDAVMVDDAKVVTADIVCKNGTIHVIDTVMMPSDASIVKTAQEAGSFKTLLAAAQAAGLAETLDTKGPFTVFAPTDDAFNALGKETIANLLKPENRDQLATILKHHVVAGRVYSPTAVSAGSATSLAGTTLPITVQSNGAMVGKAKIIATDIDTSNGVIHVIDRVMIPTMKTTQSN
jgi:uncharacterized surface protein with fasciclin (FAS1) repeats